MTDPIRHPLEGTVMLRGGSVHTPVDPFATAVLVQDGVIRWVGQEAGADSLIDDSVRVVELDGLLVAPGFVAGLPRGVESCAPEALLAAGYALAADLSSETPVVVPLDGSAPRPAGLTPRVVGDSSGAVAPAGADVAEPVLLAVDPAARETRGDDAWVDEVHALLRAGTPTGLLAVAGAEGVPNPWALARAGLREGRDPETAPGLSVRGVFNLQTRGARRVLGTDGPFHGQIVPDAPASFTVWRADALMVQTADSRIAAWSTDPRARTPLLPALESDDRFPEPRLTLLGTTAFAAPDFRL